MICFVTNSKLLSCNLEEKGLSQGFLNKVKRQIHSQNKTNENVNMDNCREAIHALK